MESFFQSIKSSARELKNVTTIAVSGMLIALSCVLCLFTIVISDVLQVRFSFLAVASSGFLFGPVVGGIVGAVGDIINYLIRPTGPFFPGFTLDALLAGFIYGLVLYKKPVTIGRVLAANTAIMIIINLFFNSLWLSIMYGQAFIALLSVRILKSLILLPVNTALLFILIRFVQKIPAFRAKGLQ